MNNPYRGGTADYWYSGNKSDLWVEYKWLAKVPVKTTNLTTGKKPALSMLQQKWLEKRHDEGRNVAVVVGLPEGVIILRKKMWSNDLCFDNLISKEQLASWITTQTTTTQTTT